MLESICESRLHDCSCFLLGASSFFQHVDLFTTPLRESSKSTSLSPRFCVCRLRQHHVICWKLDLILILFSCVFFNNINHKQILAKYYNHQEHTYCYLGSYKNTMLEQILLEQMTKIKILKEKIKVKQ